MIVIAYYTIPHTCSCTPFACQHAYTSGSCDRLTMEPLYFSGNVTKIPKRTLNHMYSEPCWVRTLDQCTPVSS